MANPSPFRIRIGANGAEVLCAGQDVTEFVRKVEIRKPLDSDEHECWLRVDADAAIDKDLTIAGALAACSVEIRDGE